MPWISAEDAIARLGVRKQTLYAYVSRGRLDARPDPADPRRSLYRLEQIEKLQTRRAGPRRAVDIAHDTIAWGEPVLTSSLTHVAKGCLYYRGRDAIKLAQTASLEEAAAFFWDTPYRPPVSAAPVPEGLPKARLFLALALRAGTDPHARGRSRHALAGDAAALVESLTNAGAGQIGDGPLHTRLAKAWGVNEVGADLIRQALVLLLDHELNPSTFSARVAASTGASMAACAIAGLATLSGPLHGEAVEDTLLFIQEGGRAGAGQAVYARLSGAGARLPGFGHPLYPNGDPRAAALLSALDLPYGLATLCKTARDEVDAYPNIDFAIASLAFVHDLPKHAPFMIFAIGRAIGWLGHAMEQLETGTLIRPRARYIGAAPQID